MESKNFIKNMLIIWIVFLPIAAYIESVTLVYSFLFYLIIDIIESIVFWIGLFFGYFVYKKGFNLINYILILFLVSIILIPGASILEDMFIQKYTFSFYLLINMAEGLLFLIGLFVGYLIVRLCDVK